MSPWSLISHSLRYFARSHFAVGAGVAAATAVIVGALVVGDSVRGSLRGLVVDRLGNLQGVLQTRKFFRPECVTRVSSSEKAMITPAIILPSATVESRHDGELLRASQVQVLGIESSFWNMASTPSIQVDELAEDEVAINAGLATELNLNVGDELTLRFEKNTGVPADNPLGRKDETAINMPRQKVTAIIPDDSIGGLSLRAGQSVPKNIFVGLKSLQIALESDETINAAWVTASASDFSGSRLCESLNEQLHPNLEDFGLQLDRHRRVFPLTETDAPVDQAAAESVVYDYYQLSSKDLILDNETVKAVESKLGAGSQRIIAYLANAIYRVDAEGKADESIEVPYSIVAGVESSDVIDLDRHTTVAIEGNAKQPCWINTWLADRLKVKPGELIQLNYFEPETVDGREIEVNTQFVVVGIVPIETPEKPYRRDELASYSRLPTVFNDPNLTPEVPGVTDQDSINNWDLPFKTNRRKVPKIDDLYWNNHRLTPKVFLRYASPVVRYPDADIVTRFCAGMSPAIRSVE